jgi:hypothetical protein
MAIQPPHSANRHDANRVGAGVDRVGGEVEDERMKYRRLRIAFSVTCGIACVLLLGLWVRSYYTEDHASGYTSKTHGFRFYSSRGCLVYYATEIPDAIHNCPWTINVGSRFWLDKGDPRLATFPRITHTKQTLNICLPYWVLVLLVATPVVALPRVRWRFSLRTLLIAMTLVAVLLGMIVALGR